MFTIDSLPRGSARLMELSGCRIQTFHSHVAAIDTYEHWMEDWLLEDELIY